MSIIQAYKSDTDGLIFEHLKDYEAHIKTLEKENNAQKRKEKKLLARKKFLIDMCQSVKSPQELVDFIQTNIDFFIENARNQYGERSRGKAQISGLTISAYTLTTPSLRWTNSFFVNNQPMMENLKPGESVAKDVGFTAQIGFTSKGNLDIASELFANTPIQLGSGGGGGEGKYSFSLYLFAQDFRLMSWHQMLDDFVSREIFNTQRVMQVLDIASEHVDPHNPTFIAICKKIESIEPKAWIKIERILLDREIAKKSKLNIELEVHDSFKI